MESKTPIVNSINLKRKVKTLALALPALILLYEMFSPAIKTGAGLIAFHIAKDTYLDKTSHKQTVRNLQKHFRKYDTSVDLNDIIHAGQLRQSGTLEYRLRGCLESNYIAYIPIKIRLPYYGIKVFEWCLKLEK